MSQTATPRQNISFFPNGASIASSSVYYNCFGGDYAWSIQGTIGGAAVTLYVLGADGVTDQQFGAARTTNDTGNTPTFSATGVGLPPCQVKAVITGGPPTGLYVTLNRIP